MKTIFPIRVFKTENYQWLFVLENDVLELFNLIDGNSERCHISAIKSFDWETDRKDRMQHLAKTHEGALTLKSLQITFLSTPEIMANADAFREKLLEKMRVYSNGFQTG